MPHEQVIIIGAGPAGIACAVQLSRYGIDPILLEKETLGGLVKNAWRMDNYPGFPDGISGPDMAELLGRHVKRFNIRCSYDEVVKASFTDGAFHLETASGNISCSYMVVATGTRPKALTTTIPEHYHDRVLREVYSVRGISGRTIDIAGAGDAAFDYAMTLASGNSVHIHNRGTQVKCVPALFDLAMRHPNIVYHENSEPLFSSEYTIFATGREAALQVLEGMSVEKRGELEQYGRLYVIGDVKNGMLRQTSIAAGDGLRAAMAIVEKIRLDEGNKQDS